MGTDKQARGTVKYRYVMNIRNRVTMVPSIGQGHTIVRVIINPVLCNIELHVEDRTNKSELKQRLPPWNGQLV